MKILKRPDNIVFDTENTDQMEFNPLPYMHLTPLHQIHVESDHEFLTKHFGRKKNSEHPIFTNFGNSYYYVVNKWL